MKIEKKLFKNLDYSILFSMTVIAVFGIITIGNALNVFPINLHTLSSSAARPFVSQAVWYIIAIIIGFYILTIDYNLIGGYYKPLYIISNLLLVIVLVAGSRRNGARSWLGFGSLGIQPSEFAKLITIITLAKVLEGMENINTLKNMGKIAIYCLIPMALIQLQPDTGTNIIFFITIIGMLFVAGLDMRFIYWGVLSAAAAAIAIWNLNIIKPYQKDRIMVFLKPETNKLGPGYNAWLARIAIGSGKFFSTYSNGLTLSTGNFIPEAHTDFIFTVFAERWGFLGAAILLVLYFNIIFRGIRIARTSKDRFGTYMIIGVLSMFTYQILQNIGMDIGIMPITGIPLPFMSYGGSSLLTSVLSIALILNVGMRRQKINF